MSRRIEIELTSSRDDTTFTWRAAGARQPKGVVSSTILPPEAAIGSVFRVEVDTGLDGTEVLQVVPDRAPRVEPEHLDLIVRPVTDDKLVTSKLSPKGGGRSARPRRDHKDGDKRGDRAGRGREPRDNARGGPRTGDDRRPPSKPRSERSERPPAPAPKPKAPRLRPSRTHRKAALEALPVEQRPIGEQVLRGGIPAVRQGIDRQNEAARADGKPEIKADGIVGIAETILPALRIAEWHDRADAALASFETVDLRDLRSVVVASQDNARDEATRALADDLREKLAARVDHEQQAWLTELDEVLREKRIVRALKLSSRPPKAGSPLPQDLMERITEAANGALTLDAGQTRWIAVIDALAFSPIRSRVNPAAIPEKPTDDLLALMTRVAGRLPELAARFGIESAPEPAKKSGRSRPAGSRRRRSPAKSPAGATPPAPTKPAATTEAPQTTGSADATDDPAGKVAATPEIAVPEATTSPENAPVEPSVSDSTPASPDSEASPDEVTPQAPASTPTSGSEANQPQQ